MDPQPTPDMDRFLAIESGRLSKILMSGAPVEDVVKALHQEWRAKGRVRRTVIFLKHSRGWALVSDSDRSLLRRNSKLLQYLAVPTENVDTSPVEIEGTPLLVYTLGTDQDEVARLIVHPVGPQVNTDLSDELFLSLSLYLKSVRDREALDSLGPRGEYARAMVLKHRPHDEGLFAEFPEIVARSKPMESVLELVRKAAPRGASILIDGESGTGKELIGQAIHKHSTRNRQTFVTENCAALTESLLEAELFGCEKGAYTGADASRPGLFERANHGTVFLDEIGEMSAGLQSKLLRVLQEREVRRVGGSQNRRVDFRLIAATHRNLDEEARAGRFRLDLLYRIDVIRVHIPPLRERPEDIPLLTSHFLGVFARSIGTPVPVVTEETLKVLAAYAWPGNVRELRNEIERAITLSPDVITPDSLSPRLERSPIPNSVAQKVRDEVGTNIYGLEKIVLGGIIRDILRETGGNKTAAARILGLPKTTLYRRMRRYGIG